MELEKQAAAWDVPLAISREKDYLVASKTLFNHNPANPEHHIYILQEPLQHEFPVVQSSNIADSEHFSQKILSQRDSENRLRAKTRFLEGPCDVFIDY